MLALTLSESSSYLDQLVMVTSPFTRHSIVPRPRAQVSSPDRVPGRRRPKSSSLKSGPRVAGPQKNYSIFVVQILYRLVRQAHSALHEGSSRCFLLCSNIYFLIQLKFNLCEKICSINQTEICLMFLMHYLMAAMRMVFPVPYLLGVLR